MKKLIYIVLAINIFTIFSCVERTNLTNKSISNDATELTGIKPFGYVEPHCRIKSVIEYDNGTELTRTDTVHDSLGRIVLRKVYTDNVLGLEVEYIYSNNEVILYFATVNDKGVKSARTIASKTIYLTTPVEIDNKIY